MKSQIEIKKESKFKNTFKKMKNALIIGSAALMLTCGGTEADFSNKDGVYSNKNREKYYEVNKFSDEVEAYADEINLKHTYHIYDNLKFSSHLEENPLLPMYVDYCSKKYDDIEILSTSYRDYYHINNNITSPKEFIFKTETKEFPEILNALIGNIEKTIIFMKLEERARPPPGIFFYFDEKNFKKQVPTISMNPFNHISILNEEVLETDKPPAMILCYARYNDDWIKQFISFGRMIIIPYDEYMEKATQIIPKEEIMQKISKQFND